MTSTPEEGRKELSLFWALVEKEPILLNALKDGIQDQSRIAETNKPKKTTGVQEDAAESLLLSQNHSQRTQNQLKDAYAQQLEFQDRAEARLQAFRYELPMQYYHPGILCHRTHPEFQRMLLAVSKGYGPLIPEPANQQPICRSSVDMAKYLRRQVHPTRFHIITANEIEWVICEGRHWGVLFGPPNSFSGPNAAPWRSPELLAVKHKVNSIFYVDGPFVFYLGEYIGCTTDLWFPLGVRYPSNAILIDTLQDMAQKRRKKPADTGPLGWGNHIRDRLLDGKEALDCVILRRTAFDDRLFGQLCRNYRG